MREPYTHTKRRDFKYCKMYFYYRHELHLQHREVRPGRLRGAAFGYAIWRGMDITDPDERLVVIRSAIDEIYDENPPSSQERADEMDFERHALECLVFVYLNRYPRKTRREVEFHLPLINPKTGGRSRKFERAGKIDGLEIIGPQKARLIEDKLSQQITRIQISMLGLDDQITEYADALLDKGWECDIAYRHTRWPSIRLRQGESVEQFKMRFAADLADRPDFYFSQQVVDFPREHFALYRQERWDTSKDILDARREGRWVRSPDRCMDFGSCPYIPLCSFQAGAEDQYITIEDSPELERRRDIGHETSE